ncbi:glycoside hydrolase family 68 protein [Nonomuraea ferruginea]
MLVAEGVNHELERPHVIVHDSWYYLFFSTHRHSFHPADCAPTGLYGFAAPSLTGPYEPLNSSGLVIQNPSVAPDQAYAWLVLPDLRVVSFANYRSHQGMDPRSAGAAQARAGFGGTVAPHAQARTQRHDHLCQPGHMVTVLKEVGVPTDRRRGRKNPGVRPFTPAASPWNPPARGRHPPARAPRRPPRSSRGSRRPPRPRRRRNSPAPRARWSRRGRSAACSARRPGSAWTAPVRARPRP